MDTTTATTRLTDIFNEWLTETENSVIEAESADLALEDALRRRQEGDPSISQRHIDALTRFIHAFEEAQNLEDTAHAGLTRGERLEKCGAIMDAANRIAEGFRMEPNTEPHEPSIDAFRESRREMSGAELEALIRADIFGDDRPETCSVYLDGFWIEHRPDGSFAMTLDRTEHRSARRDELEVLLHDHIIAHCL